MKANFTRLFILFLFIFSLINTRVFSQGINVVASLEKSQLTIGDSTVITLQINHPTGFSIDFPKLNVNDTVAKDLEISALSTILENKTDAQNILKIQKITINCYNLGKIRIAPFIFLWNNQGRVDTLKSNELFIDILNVAVDTIKTNKIDTTKTHKVFGNFNPYHTPFTFKELLKYLPYFLIVLLLVAAGFLIWYIRKKQIENKPFIEISKPKEPAHIIALRELDELEQQKIWQQGLDKQYHSQLTDILRKYIENRYQILALEKTSEELLDTVELMQLFDKELYNILKQMLISADFVKFAKAKPTAEENETGMKNAYTFVRTTKEDTRKQLFTSEEKKSTEELIKNQN